MPSDVGFIVESAGVPANRLLLEHIKDFAILHGYTLLRWSTSGSEYELILKAPGLSGTEEIFFGIKDYINVNNDIYGFHITGMTGYVPGNSYDSQPGAYSSFIPAHNQRIDYWLTLNGQRIALAMKVGTPIYTSGYVGKILAYGRPDQYPYPLFVGGMTQSIVRFSDTAQVMPYKGSRPQARLRFVDGSWNQPAAHPWAGATPTIRDTGGAYGLTPITLYSGGNVFGALDGIYEISGFDNVVENTLLIGGENYIIIQDAYRTGFGDYYAMRLDA